MIQQGERTEGSQRSTHLPLKGVEETRLYSLYSLPQGSPNSPVLVQGAAGCSGGPSLVAELPPRFSTLVFGQAGSCLVAPCGFWPWGSLHLRTPLCRGRGSGEIGFRGSHEARFRGSEVLQTAGAAMRGCQAKTCSEGPGAGIPPVPFLGSRHGEHWGFLCTRKK